MSSIYSELSLIVEDLRSQAEAIDHICDRYYKLVLSPQDWQSMVSAITIGNHTIMQPGYILGIAVAIDPVMPTGIATLGGVVFRLEAPLPALAADRLGDHWARVAQSAIQLIEGQHHGR